MDFEPFSGEAKDRDRSEAPELACEGKRREEALKRTDAMIQDFATRKRDIKALPLASGCAWIIVVFLVSTVIMSAAIPPKSALAAVLLTSCTMPTWCLLIQIIVVVTFHKNTIFDYLFGKYENHVCIGFQLGGVLALAVLAWMTIQLTERGFGWTAAIVWPGGGSQIPK